MELRIVHCDPLSNAKRKYVPRISNQIWEAVRVDIINLHQTGGKHKDILVFLRNERGLTPTLSQLGSKMSDWKLFTYRTSSLARRSAEAPSKPPCIPIRALSHKVRQESSKVDLPTGVAINATIQVRLPRLRCHIPLYSSDDQGNLVPNWSAFLMQAAEGDSMSMKTVCILARSQRFSRSQNDYLLYQNVIEAVRAELTSSDALSLSEAVMVFYAILALAIQAGFMSGLCSSRVATHEVSRSEAALHLNAAGSILGHINRQIPQAQREDTVQKLVAFEGVVSYLLALPGSASKEAPAWPLLMYHLIVQ